VKRCYHSFAVCQLLDQGPYQPDPQIDEQDLEALMDVVAKLIDEVKLDNASRVSA